MIVLVRCQNTIEPRHLGASYLPCGSALPGGQVDRDPRAWSEGFATQREMDADLSATVRAEPPADLRFHLGGERAKIRFRQQPQHLNGQGKCLVIPV